jgi:hypothetical protein
MYLEMKSQLTNLILRKYFPYLTNTKPAHFSGSVG